MDGHVAHTAFWAGPTCDRETEGRALADGVDTSFGAGLWGIWELVSGVPHFALDAGAGGVFRLVPLGDCPQDQAPQKEPTPEPAPEGASASGPGPAVSGAASSASTETAVSAARTADRPGGGGGGAVGWGVGESGGGGGGVSPARLAFRGSRDEVFDLVEDLDTPGVHEQLTARGLATQLPGIARKTANARLRDALHAAALAESTKASS